MEMIRCNICDYTDVLNEFLLEESNNEKTKDLVELFKDKKELPVLVCPRCHGMDLGPV